MRYNLWQFNIVVQHHKNHCHAPLSKINGVRVLSRKTCLGEKVVRCVSEVSAKCLGGS